MLFPHQHSILCRSLSSSNVLFGIFTNSQQFNVTVELQRWMALVQRHLWFSFGSSAAHRPDGEAIVFGHYYRQFGNNLTRDRVPTITLRQLLRHWLALVSAVRADWISPGPVCHRSRLLDTSSRQSAVIRTTRIGVIILFVSITAPRTIATANSSAYSDNVRILHSFVPSVRFYICNHIQFLLRRSNTRERHKSIKRII